MKNEYYDQKTPRMSEWLKCSFVGNRHLDTQTYWHPSPPRRQHRDLPGGLGLGRKCWSLQGIFKSGSAKQQSYSLADIQRGEERRDERKEICFLPSPTPIDVELPIWSGKVQEEKDNPPAIASKLWAGQYIWDTAEWVSSHGSATNFSFSLLGSPSNSSHLQVL